MKVLSYLALTVWFVIGVQRACGCVGMNAVGDFLVVSEVAEDCWVVIRESPEFQAIGRGADEVGVVSQRVVLGGVLKISVVGVQSQKVLFVEVPKIERAGTVSLRSSP